MRVLRFVLLAVMAPTVAYLLIVAPLCLLLNPPSEVAFLIGLTAGGLALPAAMFVPAIGRWLDR